MIKKILLVATIAVISIFATAQTKHTLDSTTLTARVVADSLDIPWEITWGPDNYIWMTERFGRVSRVNPTTGEQIVLLDMSSDVYQRSEAGMLGMVLHPDFENNSHVFIAYTYVNGSNIRERLVRYNYDGSKLTPADTLIENIVGNNTHNGSRLIILPDNTLLMTTGDAQNQNLPQNKPALEGKVLRMNLDGSIPADNPSPSSLVWTYGHRNAQGLLRAPNGIIYSSEHGPTTDDELNILSADRNYGWPTVAGFCDSPPENAFCTANNVYEPLAAWTPTIAPSDIIWYDHEAIPEFKGKLLMTVLKDQSLISFGFNGAGDSVISQKKYFKNEFKRLRDICVSPDGKIYLATSGTSWANSNPFSHTILELSNESYGVTNPNSIVEDEVLMDQIKLGPNPLQVGQPLLLSIPEGHIGEFTVIDVLGKIVLSNYVEGINAINMDSKEGVYFWKLELESGSTAEGKLIVQ